MAKFAYNNAKNAGTGYTSFELNCDYYTQAPLQWKHWFSIPMKISRWANNQDQKIDNYLQREPLACLRAIKAITQYGHKT